MCIRDSPCRANCGVTNSRKRDSVAAEVQDAKVGACVAKRTHRNSRVAEVIAEQGKAGGAAAPARAGVAGSTRGSTTGAVSVAGPPAGARSPFKRPAGTVPSPVCAAQGTSGAAAVPVPKARKTGLPKFQQAMSGGCFSVSGLVQPGKSVSASKMSQGCAGPAQTSGTAGDVTTVLPQHLLASPGNTSPSKGQVHCGTVAGKVVNEDATAQPDSMASAGTRQPCHGTAMRCTRSTTNTVGGQLTSVPEENILEPCEVRMYQSSVRCRQPCHETACPATCYDSSEVGMLSVNKVSVFCVEFYALFHSNGSKEDGTRTVTGVYGNTCIPIPAENM